MIKLGRVCACSELNHSLNVGQHCMRIVIQTASHYTYIYIYYIMKPRALFHILTIIRKTCNIYCVHERTCIYSTYICAQSMAYNETGAFPGNPERVSGNDVYRVRFAKKLFRTLLYARPSRGHSIYIWS